MGLHLRIGAMRCPALGPAVHARANGLAYHAIFAARQAVNSRPRTTRSQSSYLTSLHDVRDGRCCGLISSRRVWPPASAAHPSDSGTPAGHLDAISNQQMGSHNDVENKTIQSQPQASLSDVLLDGQSVETGGPWSAPADRSNRFALLPPLHKELLQLEDRLRDGSIRSGVQEDRLDNIAKGFRQLAKFDPLSLNASAKLTRAAEAARRNLMHALAAEFMPLLPNVTLRYYLNTALLACSRTGYGWGVTTATEAAAGAEGELPLAQAVLDRLLQVLSRAPDAYTSLDAALDEFKVLLMVVIEEHAASRSSGGGASVAAKPSTLAMHGSAYPVLLALVRLRPNVLRNPPRPVADWLFPRLEYNMFGDDAQLCEVTQALGELVVQAPALRRALEPKPGAVAAWVRKLVRVVQARLEQKEEGMHRPWGRQQQQWMVSAGGLGVRHTCQLLRGCWGIHESFRGGNSSSSRGDGPAFPDPDSLERVATDAVAAAGLAASQLERLDFDELPPPELAEAAYTLARFGYGSNSCYRAVAAAAEAAHGTFATAATPADWAQLWHGLALVRHRPDKALVRRMAAALTTEQEQQHGSATAHDCATLLCSLAVLRCYDKGLVGWLLGRLVQLLQLLPPSGGDVSGQTEVGLSGPGADMQGGGAPGVALLPDEGVRVQDLTSSLWAVAVMGPGVLAAHCGAVGELLREAAGRWEQRSMGAGEERQQVLRQLRQVQLELEAVQGATADGQGAVGSGGENADCSNSNSNSSSSSSSSSSSVCVSPRQLRQLRQLLPPELLLQAVEEVVVWEGPGGAGRGAPGRRLQCLRDEVLAVLQGMVEGGQQGQRRTASLPSDTSNTAAPEPPPASNTGIARAAPLLWRTVVASVTPDAALPELPCCVDFMVELADGRRLVVEVEGPGQLLGNHPHTGTRTGRAELRRRQLERVLGSGCVLGVCYWEWEELGGERGRQEAWLGARLAPGMWATKKGSSGDQGAAAAEEWREGPWWRAGRVAAAGWS